MENLKSSDPIKLNIVLENMPLSVFRKVLVPEDINMYDLHVIIQLSMGWEFDHLFQFSDKKTNPNIVVSDEGQDEEEIDDLFGDVFNDFGIADYGSDELLAEKTLLKEEFMIKRERKPFYYWYDFGDDWWHKITFQKPTKKEMSVWNGNPVCIDAAGACPPEDSGGPWGYSYLLEVLSNKKHEEHEDMKEWLGLKKNDKYDPDFVDLNEINKRLKEF